MLNVGAQQQWYNQQLLHPKPTTTTSAMSARARARAEQPHDGRMKASTSRVCVLRAGVVAHIYPQLLVTVMLETICIIVTLCLVRCEAVLDQDFTAPRNNPFKARIYIRLQTHDKHISASNYGQQHCHSPSTRAPLCLSIGRQAPTCTTRRLPICTGPTPSAGSPRCAGASRHTPGTPPILSCSADKKG